MSLKWWEVDLRGKPTEQLFTLAGIKQTLPNMLFDLDFYSKGGPEEFIRVLLESFPLESYPISITVLGWKEGDGGDGETRLRRFYPEWVLDDLGLGSRELRSLEKNVERIWLPSVTEGREIEGNILQQFGSIRVTYSAASGSPSRKELHSVLKAFDDSGEGEATVLLQSTRSLSLNGEDSVEEESMEFFLERVPRHR